MLHHRFYQPLLMRPGFRCPVLFNLLWHVPCPCTRLQAQYIILMIQKRVNHNSTLGGNQRILKRFSSTSRSFKSQLTCHMSSRKPSLHTYSNQARSLMTFSEGALSFPRSIGPGFKWRRVQSLALGPWPSYLASPCIGSLLKNGDNNT